MFGRAFAVLRLHTLFALTITLIVVPFVIMAITIYTLHISNKLYYFSNTPEQNYTCGGANETRTTRGLRGLTRLPVAIVIASGAVVGAAFLINKVNPMIAYTSQYSVWAMFLSLWWSLAWFVLRGASAVRPTALARGYAFLGQWALWWVILIGVAVSIDRLDLASGYWVLVSYTGVFLSAWISLLELFGLPKKPTPESLNSRWDEAAAAVGQSGGGEISEDEITEATPLFAGSITTFGGYSSIQESQHSDAGRENDVPCDGEFSEQAWSKDMPTWVWIPQFFLSVPFPLILTASIGLLLSTATNQTGADGSSTLTFYLILAVFSIAILLPGTPFYHRISHHVTTTIFFIFIGTLIYNLSAFPFSDHYKLKVYFQQSVNLDSSAATTYLVGHPAYTANIVRDFIPSAWNQNITVHPDPLRVGLSRVEWSSAPLPLVAPGPIREWVSFNVTKYDERHAMVVIEAKETRACKIQFDNAVSGVVVGQSGVPLGKPVAKGGAKEVRLWRREWEGAWEVDVKWDSEVGAGSRLAGRVVCLWSDANDAGNAVPALREVQRFLPRWAVASKLADGLVEGWRAFEV